jgi:hypothetical protein
MSLSDLASIGSFVSGIAVLASLIYLSLQVSQNTKHSRALIQQGRVTGITTNYLAMADADLAAAHIIGNGGIASPEEIKRRQFWLECTTALVRTEDSFFQHEAGLISDAQFSRAQALFVEVLKGGPGLRQHFERNVLQASSSTTSAAFKKFVRDALVESGATTAVVF